jgi:ATP-dependent RNA helicase DDX56/DBP9
MALSFVVHADVPTANNPQAMTVAREGSDKDEAIFAKIEKNQAARGSKIKEYNFDMKQVEAFRYRMQDALRAVTRHAVKEARLKELKTEILNSDKLKVHPLSRASPTTADTFLSTTQGPLRGQP